MNNPKERRKHPRIKKQLRVVIHRKRFFFLWEGRDVAELVDISMGGAQVNTKRVLAQGDRVVVSIQPRSYSPAFHFHGKIAWIRTRYLQNRKYMQVGVQFKVLGPLQRALMKRLSGAAVSISPA
jgi:Tfp pilus assembly protein PilZ